MLAKFGTVAVLVLNMEAAHAGNPPAGDTRICEAPALLDSRAVDCMDNTLYEQAARKCVKTLLGTVGEESARTSRVMNHDNRAALDGGKNRQAGDLAAATGDYDTARNGLQFLLDEASRTHGLLEQYRSGMVLPFDCGGDCTQFEDAIWSHPCYADAASAIDGMLKEVDGISANLTAAYKQNLSLFGAAGTRRAGMEGGTGAAVSSTHGAGSGVRGGKTTNGQSTITGTIPDHDPLAGSPTK